MDTTARRIKRIDEEIRHAVDARRRAVARKRKAEVRRLDNRIKMLQRQRAALAASSGGRGLLARLKPRLPGKPAGLLQKVLPKGVFTRSADKPPVGVVDIYRGVTPTQKNAPTLAAYYHARAKRKLITRQARAYYLLRLEQVKPFLPNKTGPGKLLEAAKMHRRTAARAAGARNYAAATRLTEQAASLEQQARSLAIQETSSQEGAPYVEDAEASTALPADSEAESMETTPETEEKAWYANPLVWAGGAVGLVLLASLSKKGKGAGGSTSSVRRSYVVSSAAKSSRRPAASSSLTRSL